MTDEAADELLIRAVAADQGVVGDPARVGPLARALVEESRRCGAVEALVVSLRATAWAERSRMANVRARVLLDEAASLARAAELPTRLGEVLITRSAVHQELGNPERALADLRLARTVVDESAMPDLEHKLATLLHNVGRLADATDAYCRVLDHPGSTPASASAAANNLGLIESLRGRSDLAIRYLDQARDLAPAVGPVRVAFVAHNRGLVLTHAGRLSESLGQFEEASRLLDEAGLPLGEFHFEHADALAELRLVPEARALAVRAADDLASRDVPLMAAEARLRVAQTALLGADLGEAIRSAELAREQFRRHRRGAWSARATVVLAEAARLRGAPDAGLLRSVAHAASVLGRHGVQGSGVDASLAAGRLAAMLGRDEMARRWLHEAHRRARGGSLLVRLKGELAAALAASIDGNEHELLVHCRAGLRDLARHRVAFGSVELRALAAGHGIELGLLGLGALLATRSPTRVLDWVERTRAAAALTVEPPAPEAVREERAELAAVQAELMSARREGGSEPRALVARQATLEQAIRRATWHFATAGNTTGNAVRTAQLVDLLDGATLASFGRYDDELFAVVLEGRRRRLVGLGPYGPVRFEADAAQFALRRLAHGPQSSRAADGAARSLAHSLQQLRQMLITPLRVDPDAQLVVVPARDTHRLPWSSLHRGPVSVAPSASLWAATRRRPRARTDRVVVVAGPDLPGAEREVEAVAACHPGAVLLTPPKSTAQAVLDAIAGSNLVHLACHGYPRADNPTFSALEVTDGRLTVHELDLRGIAPPRVVLAACDSAADVNYDGGELIGFISALLARGTVGAVASVVAVGDAEAVPLMSSMHRGLAAGMTMSVALHAARAEIDTSEHRSLVNWCAFTAYGAG